MGKQKEEPKHVDIQKASEMLKCDLQDTELLQFGEDLANAQSEIHELNTQLDGIKKEYKSKTSALEAEVDKLGNLLRQKYQMREVECEVTCDYDEGIVIVKRMDTGEEVKRRPMTDSELQRELKLFPEKPGAGAGATVTEDQITEAVQIIGQAKRAATTLLQRRMGIGYTKAARIMDVLEERGVVSAPNGAEPREILIDPADYEPKEELPLES